MRQKIVAQAFAEPRLPFMLAGYDTGSPQDVVLALYQCAECQTKVLANYTHATGCPSCATIMAFADGVIERDTDGRVILSDGEPKVKVCEVDASDLAQDFPVVCSCGACDTEFRGNVEMRASLANEEIYCTVCASPMIVLADDEDAADEGTGEDDDPDEDEDVDSVAESDEVDSHLTEADASSVDDDESDADTVDPEDAEDDAEVDSADMMDRMIVEAGWFSHPHVQKTSAAMHHAIHTAGRHISNNSLVKSAHSKVMSGTKMAEPHVKKVGQTFAKHVGSIVNKVPSKLRVPAAVAVGGAVAAGALAHHIMHRHNTGTMPPQHPDHHPAAVNHHPSSEHHMAASADIPEEVTAEMSGSEGGSMNWPNLRYDNDCHRWCCDVIHGTIGDLYDGNIDHSMITAADADADDDSDMDPDNTTDDTTDSADTVEDDTPADVDVTDDTAESTMSDADFRAAMKTESSFRPRAGVIVRKNQNRQQNGRVEKDSTTIKFDMLAHVIQDRSASLSLVKSSDGPYYLFANGTPAAQVKKEKVTASLLKVYQKPAFAEAFVQATRGGLTQRVAQDFGLEAVSMEVPVDTALVQKTRSEVNAQVAETRKYQTGLKDKMEQCMIIASTGLARQAFGSVGHPVRDNMIASLEEVGVRDPRDLVDQVLAESITPYTQLVMAKTMELLAKSDDELRGISDIIKNIEYVPSRSPGGSSSNFREGLRMGASVEVPDDDPKVVNLRAASFTTADLGKKLFGHR